MSLEDRAREAREIADRSTDWRDHRIALALEGAVAAERQALKYAEEPPAGDTSDLPPWSEVSASGGWTSGYGRRI
jgi:hypothetical protein